MPNFTVELMRSDHFIIAVVAADEEEAREKALEAIAHYENPEEEALDSWSDGFETLGCTLHEYPEGAIDQLIPYITAMAERGDDEAKALLEMLAA